VAVAGGSDGSAWTSAGAHLLVVRQVRPGVVFVRWSGSRQLLTVTEATSTWPKMSTLTLLTFTDQTVCSEPLKLARLPRPRL
jgi:hypothetical protein